MKKKAKKGFGDFKRDLRREVYRLFETSPNKPLNHKQVAAALGISDSGIRTLIFELLNLGVEEGSLKEIERGKFQLAHSPEQTYSGIIEINRFGKGYVNIEGFEKDIEIPKGKTGFALYGDTVEITVNPKSKRPEGKITKVVQRSRNQYVGILEMGKGNAFMIPSDRRIHVDFFIPKDQMGGASNGDKVVVEITGWDRPDSNPFGKVVKVLGKPGEHQTEIHAIIAEFGLPNEFPDELEQYADKIPSGITPEEIANRKDFRSITTFTIDPFDAKDFDDALSYRKLENGNVEVGVHIADVSFYLRPEGMLESEAFKRATSVYLVDRTIPMLPEKLSNELCSLRPNEEKLCFSAVFELNQNAEVVKEWFGRTIILSDRRFTYEEAQEIIEKGEGEFAEELRDLDRMAKLMRVVRYAKGSIDFNTEEVKFKLDEKGAPIGVYVKKMKDSNQLIEDFMLLANKQVATLIGKSKSGMPKTFVYRVHDDPDPLKIQQLRTFLKHLGHKLPRPMDAEDGHVIKALLKMVEGTAEEDMVKTMAIRTMAKAEYSTHNIGHYGLAFEYYCHFTSPIRRYPDVMVHRLLQHYLDGGKSVDEKEYELKCRHSSLMEKRASEAERASIKFKQVEFMMARHGEIFEGVISGLTGWGMYVEVLENKCEGMVSVQNMTDDMYEFDSDSYIMRGVRTRQEFHMGDKVMIRVVDGNIQQRTLDFELIGMERRNSAFPIQRQSSGPRSNRGTKSFSKKKRK